MDSTLTLPLFPLQIVQFPGVVTPLHIFEMRYRKMLKDVLAGDKTFGIIAVLGDATSRPLLGSIGCTAKVVIAQEMDDGRSNILCVGEQRFRMLDYEEGEPYLQARVEFFEDETAFEDFSIQTEEAKTLFARIAKLARQIKESDQEEETPELPEDPQALSFMLAAYLDLKLTEKQEMLELTDTGIRLQYIIKQLSEMVDEYQRRLLGRKISKVNGHGGKLPKIG